MTFLACLRTFRGVAVLLSMAALITVCGRDIGLGDRGHGIYFHNATRSNVVLYELGRDNPDVGVHRMAPDALLGSSWAVPANSSDTRTVRVEATIDDKLIFCRTFGWNDLDYVRWRIEIIPMDGCR
jgi:hypothetical protein